MSKVGRPSLYSEELLNEIVERLAGGEPLAVICREDGMPTARTIRAWIGQKAQVSSAIAQAREDGEDWLAAECLLIADTPREGYEEKYELNDKGEMVLIERKKVDMLGHRKLQIETRLKLLAKWNPRKFGDKLDVTGHMTLEQLVAGISKPVGESE